MISLRIRVSLTSGRTGCKGVNGGGGGGGGGEESCVEITEDKLCPYKCKACGCWLVLTHSHTHTHSHTGAGGYFYKTRRKSFLALTDNSSSFLFFF